VCLKDVGLEQGEGQRPGRKREPTGELIGSYEVIAQIAAGESTTVHLAQKRGALGFHRLAAIKRLKPEFAKRNEWTALLLEEARLSAGVHHANIVDVVDLGTDSGTYLVMDYVEGADFDALLARAGKERHPRYVLPPIVDALHGLHAVHTAVDEEGDSLAMVHQAPRARHILLGIDGTARITDFSQIAARGLTPSYLRKARLKPAYMAPEQVRGRAIDARTDVFIVGIVLWEALTGERLFQAETSEASKRAVLERHIPRPSDVGYRPPRGLDRVCLRALARDPAERYPDAAEMARDLRDVGLNEALYATSSEVGQWVRALAGRSLIERRRALGADAPSLEIAIDAFENGAGNAVEIAHVSTAVTPAPAAVRSEWEDTPTAGPSGGPLPQEPSRVTRLYTVTVAAPTGGDTPAPSNLSSPGMTLLGMNDDERGRALEALLPSKSAPPQTKSPGAYRHIAAERRAAATLPEGSRAHEQESPVASVVTPRPSAAAADSWPVSNVASTAREHEAMSAPAPRAQIVPARREPRVPLLDYADRDGTGRGDGSLRPPSRAAHMDLPNIDDEVESSGGLGFIAFLSLTIIALAGFVGYRQWTGAGGEQPELAPSAAPNGADPLRSGDRELERVPSANDPQRAAAAAPTAPPDDALDTLEADGGARAATPGLNNAPNTEAAPKGTAVGTPGAPATPNNPAPPVARPAPGPRPAPRAAPVFTQPRPLPPIERPEPVAPMRAPAPRPGALPDNPY
jgi:eukaryotic-like serine/threonine-protein kinase